MSTYADEKIIYGTITNIKTSKPYPFVSPQSGNVHECKVKIGYFEYDEEEQELEYYTYKAYPINGQREFCSKSLMGQRVQVKVEYNEKSPRRGEIQSLVVVH